MSKQQTYTVKTALPHRGRVYQPGEPITLHPRQAKYLLGTHLERPGVTTPPAKPRKAKAEGQDKGGVSDA
ncbi:hypothetical protein Tgr7_1631 [Thioalkalivibrio sulfidiphilus HL-EbGr7]|uniref:DUF7210 domain-containing protein n=1 Tax=Thioalkalivibrio sulfidiphilus (strain HL-EbGR7) TaxID=396588 RepID=B8GS10_THISH|nr:hypothetical protein [Thioalkalivibrio sulfidiphilus]ACL72714.1 hypothetical protein Tgr7_1631 [Thioalkalivibrio sulfidiphilus HL-EbGr7]